MSHSQVVDLSNLLVDSGNPRISNDISSQREAITSIAKLQERKLIKLAEDIISYGVNPAEALMVMENPAQREFFIVLEGNRRITALKILENPDIVKDVVQKNSFEKFKKLSEQYLEDPVLGLNCLVFESRDDAHHWIELKHTGENEGAGVVPWGSPEIDRFRKRTGQKSQSEQILDFLETRGYISNSSRSATPVSSLKRLLSTPYVREKLGICIENGIVKTSLPEGEVAKGLKKVVIDLAEKNIRTGDIYHSQNRVDYIDRLKQSDLPDLSQSTNEIRQLEDTTPGIVKSKKTSAVNNPSLKNRKALIPSKGFAINIGQTRINDIYHELRKLNIEQFTNAVSVLFRVFLELSLDEYCGKYSVQVNSLSRLSGKMNLVAEDLKQKGRLNDQQLKPVRRAAQKDSFLGGTLTTMNQYVHNPSFHPAPSDLIASWDSLQPFIIAMWEQ